MQIERLVGFLLFIGILFFLMFSFYPSTYIEKTISLNILDEDFNGFNDSDFDLFVYRAHVLSSAENANMLKDKIINGGYPSFISPYGDKEKLLAVYVGPFLSKDDILKNITEIKLLSQSKNGEISIWKL